MNEDLTNLAEEIVDFCNAVESACVSLKMQIAKIFGPEAKTKTAELPGSEDLSKLPWKSYKTKQDAKENEAAWIFSNCAGGEVLLATLKAKNDGKARIGTYDFQLQGNQKQFISRRPVKN
jgi:hypothetical protein